MMTLCEMIQGTSPGTGLIVLAFQSAHTQSQVVRSSICDSTAHSLGKKKLCFILNKNVDLLFSLIYIYK